MNPGLSGETASFTGGGLRPRSRLEPTRRAGPPEGVPDRFPLPSSAKALADHGDHVTSDQFKTAVANLEARIADAEARLTWRFAGAMLAQTGVILAAVIAPRSPSCACSADRRG